jgi:hypothetical protein
MMDENKLENYLYQLEIALKDLHPSERAKIVLENRDQILDSRQKYPDKSMGEILDDLGPAEKVANHYLLDRGLKTYRPNKHPFWKWFSIMFLGSMGLLMVSILVMVWKFTPLFKVDEKNQRVIILGGLIDVNGVSGKIKVGDQYQFIPNKFNNQFNGTIDVPRDEFDELVINFKSGSLDFKTNIDRKLSWDCKLEKAPGQDFINMGKDIIEIDLEKTGGSSCMIGVPIDLKLTVDGEDGQISIEEPEFDTYIDIDNGSVRLMVNPEVEYKYDLSVRNGSFPKLKSSENEDAYEIKIHMENGKILKN